jgi:hypothetical protein
MKKISIVLLTVINLFTPSFVSAQITTKNLFKIERNKNTNVVMYDIRLNPDNNINKANPIDSYWIINTKQGQREEISTFEKKAYGYNIKYNATDDYDLTLKAVPDRIIKIVKINGKVKATIKINGKDAYLNSVYVFAINKLIPKVLYYIITGTDISTDIQVTEKIETK